jgi:HSP20 family molecular chaperone IbpA
MIDKEKPYFELSKIQDLTKNILDAVFIKNFQLKKNYKVDVDIFNIDNKIILVVSLPGVDPKETEFLVDKDEVIVKAHRNLFLPQEMLNLKDYNELIQYVSNNAIAIENYYGDIHRKIKLPFEVELDNIKVIYVRGMFFVYLNKKSKQKLEQKKDEEANEK